MHLKGNHTVFASPVFPGVWFHSLLPEALSKGIDYQCNWWYEGGLLKGAPEKGSGDF
jgi:hypothetical protein